MTFNEFRDTKFNGDEEAAFFALYEEMYFNPCKYTETDENCAEIIKSLKQQNKMDKFRSNLLKYDAVNAERIANRGVIYDKLDSLKLSFDEVKDAKENPFKAKLLKSFFKTAITAGTFLAVIAVANFTGNMDLIGLLAKNVYSIVGAYVSIDLGINLSKYFRYNSLKDLIEYDNALKKDVKESLTEYDDLSNKEWKAL